MQIGEAYSFVPTAFGAELDGKREDGKIVCIPRKVTGHSD